MANNQVLWMIVIVVIILGVWWWMFPTEGMDLASDKKTDECCCQTCYGIECSSKLKPKRKCTDPSNPPNSFATCVNPPGCHGGESKETCCQYGILTQRQSGVRFQSVPKGKCSKVGLGFNPEDKHVYDFQDSKDEYCSRDPVCCLNGTAYRKSKGVCAYYRGKSFPLEACKEKCCCSIPRVGPYGQKTWNMLKIECEDGFKGECLDTCKMCCCFKGKNASYEPVEVCQDGGTCVDGKYCSV